MVDFRDRHEGDAKPKSGPAMHLSPVKKKNPPRSRKVGIGSISSFRVVMSGSIYHSVPTVAV